MINNTLVKLFAFTLTAFLPLTLFGHSAGADPGFSGAPGDSTCVACHGGTPNTGSGSVAISFPQGSYTPGTTYKVTVTVADPAALRWGFEITARTSANLQAGTFAPVDALTQAISDSSLLYETHTSAGTRRGTPVSAAFDLNWTAPATAVGDVTFYAAGNAANNNGSPDPGDKIYTTQLAVPASSSPVTTPTLRTDQPVLQSFSELAKMSPGTWIELYGTNLSATTRQWQGSDFQGNTAPTQLDGVGVLIDDVPAYVYYISNTQINVQVPNINPTGNSTIVITGPGGVRSAPLTMARSAVSPALLAPPAFKPGNVQYVAANFPDLVTFAGTPNLVAGAPFRAAKAGDTVILYAVGCGHANPDVAPGQKAVGLSDLTLPVRVTVGGQDATINYKGFYPPFVGLYRIDINIPQVAAGDQPIDLLVDGVSTGQSTFITIGN